VVPGPPWVFFSVCVLARCGFLFILSYANNFAIFFNNNKKSKKTVPLSKTEGQQQETTFQMEGQQQETTFQMEGQQQFLFLNPFLHFVCMYI